MVGGGTVSSPRPADPFRLTARAPLANFSLPSDPVGLGSYELQASFPSLGGFSQALFVAGVPGQHRQSLAGLKPARQVSRMDPSWHHDATRIPCIRRP
jgi:hypothetical protein